ncbi:MAG: threonine ammonia-lyase [Desulfarculus sp.]|nr:MAG: threonine ammonia-lyase [Desulfarculus sp.]
MMDCIRRRPVIFLQNIEKMRRLLGPVAFHTPLAPSPHLGNLVGAEVFLKLENLQRTGSFKIRGAYARLHRLAQERPGAGVVAASAGNHAQGVAVSARLLGLKAVIFMPVGVSLSKREATVASGAEIRLKGESVAECLEAARALTPELTLIHPYDDEQVILGQASLGLEILEDLPQVQAVVVPVGGGGLIGGVAAAIKAKAPSVRVVGVEPSLAASAAAALREGRPVTVATEPTLADGACISRVGELTLPLIQRYVDDMVQVAEEHIAQAMLLLLERRRIVVEGAGALGLAAFLAEAVPALRGKRVVLLISGGNVDSNLLGRIIDQGLVRSGRIYRFSVVLPDRPGALAGLLTQVAAAQANVLHISHDRLAKGLPPRQSRVSLEIETRGFAHAQEVAAGLETKGYPVQPE